MLLTPSKCKSVALIALGKSCYNWVQLNHQNLSYTDVDEVWTINSGGITFRHDLVWDMHDSAWIDGMLKNHHVKKRRECFVSHDKPIVMPRSSPEFPTSLTFPLRQAIEVTNSCYFSTGLAYPLAWAYVLRKIGELETLKLHGCDFSYDRNTNTHDEQGRACAEYWVGRLIEAGVRIEVTSDSHFLDMLTRCKGRIYGYSEPVIFEFPVDGGKGNFISPDYESNVNQSRI